MTASGLRQRMFPGNHLTGFGKTIKDETAMKGNPGRESIGMDGLGVCVGFPVWKRPHVKPFFCSISDRVIYIEDPSQAVKCAKSNNSRIITWASSEKKELDALAKAEGIDVVRMEDGFLRSVGLGSDFHVPYSLVLDKKGIYYDPSRPSELEYILEKGGFDGRLLDRARCLKQQIISKEVTKYNVGTDMADDLSLPSDKLIIFVPGQVENDASLLRCSSDIDTNVKLLEAVRKARPQAFILYKPHPDVLAGNRAGRIPNGTACKFCDRIVGTISAGTLINQVDEVHTISSLTGFEALLRSKNVYTYGGPFYAGWGLTADRLLFPRRTRRVTLDELIAATLILYPTYYDWETNMFCGPETILHRLSAQHDRRFKLDWLSQWTISRLTRMFFSPYISRKR